MGLPTERHDVSLRPADWDHGLAHDIRSPLCALLGYLHLLERQASIQASPKALEYITLMREAAGRVGEMVETFLDHSLASETPWPVQRAPVDVEELFGRLHHLFSLSASQKRVSLFFQSRTHRVWADRSLLQRVLENLISNAIKFTPAGGHITVSADAQPGRCLFEVADTGRGISAEQRETIFEKWRQAHPEDRRSGYGLGLVVVKHIIDAHEGQIWVDSEPGAGSRFIFWLPSRALPTLGFTRALSEDSTPAALP